MVRFAEALEMDDFPLAQEPDYVVDIRIITQAEDIIIGNAGLLLWCNRKRTTSGLKMASKRVRDAVDFPLEAFQRLLQSRSV